MNRPRPSRAVARAIVVLSIALSSVVVGCGGSHPLATGDPLTDMRDAALPVSTRERAVEQAWSEATGGQRDRTAVREALKRTVWQTGNPQGIRLAAIRCLLGRAGGDATPDERADTRNMLRLLLPKEPDRAVIALVCREAAEGGWAEAAPEIVRSWSRFTVEPPDNARVERETLVRLFPGQDPVRTVYNVFVAPIESDGMRKDLAERARSDAWELLGRLDPDGSRRAGFLAEPAVPNGGEPEILTVLRRVARDLKAVPVTGAQLDWARSLSDPSLKSNASWWSEAARAIAGLTHEQLQGWSLRHAEPARWAAAHRPEWLGASREQLLSELGSRLDGRKTWRRSAETGEGGAGIGETLAESRTGLCWGDALTILVIDEAMADPAVRAAFFEQAERDRRDTSTEYGGLLGPTVPGGFAAILYEPRPTQRAGDRRFIASDDMIRDADLSLAHYHFHVQSTRNAEYAGPGPGDMEFADRYGRSCIVLTSIADGILNADYYQPGGIRGVRIDLGEIRR
ncbi:MAG: hypothetical protein JNM07_08950 [Phycisphaerae bacterium]|nr:hypothetical protein [Phycisphaerae bacterium]